MARPRCLLLNPPGTKRWLRDCFHSNATRTRYYWHPLDLLIQSGWLGEVADVDVVDAIAQGIDRKRCLDAVTSVPYDFVLFLTGEKSFGEDRGFMDAFAARRPGARLFAAGDVVYFRGARPFDEFANLWGIVTDFSAGGLAGYARGRRGTIPGLRYRDDDGEIRDGPPEPGPMRYPLPLHEKFDRGRYRLPFFAARPFASVLTTYGCPHRCDYCNANGVGFHERPAEDVLGELEDLGRRGYGTIYFRDPTFALRREHGLEICRGIVSRGLRFEWNAFARPDALDRELIRAMAAAGCRMLQFGIESPDADSLEARGKRADVERIRETFAACRELGIMTSGHYMVGLPGEDERTWDRIVPHAIALGCDYLAVNVAEVRLGSRTGGSVPAADLGRRRFLLDEKRLLDAARSLNRGFYLRPAFVAAQLRRLSGPGELLRVAELGIDVIAGGGMRR